VVNLAAHAPSDAPQRECSVALTLSSRINRVSWSS
jgi:hypothetical protein